MAKRRRRGRRELHIGSQHSFAEFYTGPRSEQIVRERGWDRGAVSLSPRGLWQAIRRWLRG